MTGKSQFLLYAAPDGAVKVEVLFEDETVWLAQKALAEDSVCSIFEPPAPYPKGRLGHE